MAFDLIIKNENDKISGHIKIEADQHYQLMKLANQLDFCLLNRMFDYYADVFFKQEELVVLEKELKILQNYCKKEKDELLPCVNKFLKLVFEAKEMKTGISGISD